MKKAIFILIILIFSVLYYMGFLTKEEILPFSKDFFSIESSTFTDWPLDLKEVPSLRSQNIDRDTFFLNEKELDKLYQLKLDKGIRNLPVLSTLLIREAEKSREKGNIDQAVQMANYSVKFSPNLPYSYFELANLRWHQNPLNLQKILPEMVRGWSVQFCYYPTSIKIFYNIFYILSNAILITFIIFGIVVMIKYFPLYFYDIRKNITKEISKLLTNSLKVFLIFIPFFLRLDMLWAILFWSILLWGYAPKKERQFILIFFVLLVYLPFFFRSYSSFLNGPTSDILLEMHHVNYENWNKMTEEKLQAWLIDHPDDPEVLFTLGLIEKRRGRYSQAEEFYQRAIQEAPRFSEAYSNLGNVYLAKKQTDLAVTSYQQAAQLNPNKGAYFYNLYRAYSQETFLSGKIDEVFQRARQLSPGLVDYYLKIESPNINRLVIDEAIGIFNLWRRFLTQFIGKEGILFRLFKAWFENIPSRIPFLAPILFLGFLIGVSRYSRTRRFLTRCPMCGSPTYRFYLGASNQEFICFNCYRIFIQKERLHPRIEEKKSIQARKFEKENHLIKRLLSFVFIGFSDLWNGHFFKGFIFLFLFFIFILRFAYWDGVVTSPFVQPSRTLWRMIFWGVLFILFYFISIRKVYRVKRRYEVKK